MKRRRVILAVSLVWVAAAGLVFLGLRPRGPAYGHQHLSQWLAEVDPEIHRVETKNQASLRRDRVVKAIQGLGSNAVPYLLDRLRDKAKPPGLRDKVQDLLDKQSWVDINLPDTRDRAWEASFGFKALGSAGVGAIPALVDLMAPAGTPIDAAECLEGIGVEAVPALLDVATTNADVQVRVLALCSVANLGRAAGQAAPVLVSIMNDPTNQLAGVAMQALAEVDPDPARHIARFAEGLASSSSLCFSASIALARSGSLGLRLLVQTLTPAPTNSAVNLALDPSIWDGGQNRQIRFYRGTYGTAGLALVPNWDALTDHPFLPGARFGSGAGGPQYNVDPLAPRLISLLRHPSPALRLEAMRALRYVGAKGAPGLSRAALDADANVVQEAKAGLGRLGLEVSDGGIVRGPKDRKRIALLFTGHEYAEGATAILDELGRHHARASFFLTGRFLLRSEFQPLVSWMRRDHHYVGPHSYGHLLYCPWEGPKRTLVTRGRCLSDLLANCDLIRVPAVATNPSSFFPTGNLGTASWPIGDEIAYFLPPYEHYNLEIAEWSRELGLTLVNYTPGTRSNADYTGEADTNFVSSQRIFDSIVAREREDPNGLNGFLLLLHLGAGPGRADKFHERFGELLDYLAGKGYEFVRVDEMMTEKGGAGEF